MVKAQTLDYVVASTDQLAATDVGSAAGQTYAQAKADMANAIMSDPTRRGALQVVAHYEVPNG
jgi:hypothetical protein